MRSGMELPRKGKRMMKVLLAVDQSRHSLAAARFVQRIQLPAGSALLQVGIVLSPWTEEIFKTTLLTPQDWLLVMGVGMLPLVAMELVKKVRAEHLHRPAANHR